MKLGWQKLLPLAIGNLIFYAAAIAIIDLNLGVAAWVALAIGAIVAFFAILRPQAQTAL
jgi:hypothetical protein